MSKRFVVEVTDDEYQMLLKMARCSRKEAPERLKDYSWKEAAQDALSQGIVADWEYGSYASREG